VIGNVTEVDFDNETLELVSTPDGKCPPVSKQNANLPDLAASSVYPVYPRMLIEGEAPHSGKDIRSRTVSVKVGI